MYHIDNYMSDTDKFFDSNPTLSKVTSTVRSRRELRVFIRTLRQLEKERLNYVFVLPSSSRRFSVPIRIEAVPATAVKISDAITFIKEVDLLRNDLTSYPTPRVKFNLNVTLAGLNVAISKRFSRKAVHFRWPEPIELWEIGLHVMAAWNVRQLQTYKSNKVGSEVTPELDHWCSAVLSKLYYTLIW